MQLMQKFCLQIISNYFQVQILFATTSHIFVLIIMEGLEDDVHATHLICRFSGFKLFNDLNN